MIDATRSATPMPAQPEATVTHPEAPFPPADPLPYGVAPAVTDPASNPDFLPVDDAFALELRAESIEQLSGGDALRRGESERIEAGRSETNADLVAGRDRVRVHGALHEHTGHGLAEQAAHLDTAVEGRLDVHAASEDTVLLAGHMSDLWDGGTAIVAAMSDDTVAGGGIRVTAPLDLWVHAVMGVEERIGTCTADAVLMELAATHYEREYGPGVHAAGLAVYTGSLYQSSRSTFRPLMRVSSGVRNLIAGGGGGDGGGDGSGASAPDASPPPVPAQTGAAAAAVTGTLAAGRRAAEAPATALDAADGLTGARCVPLEELVNSVDVRAAEAMGEAGAVMRAEDLPELTRSADTAEQLEALQETLRMNTAASASEAAGGLRASEFEGAVSVHPASGAGGALEIEPPSAVYGENAPMVRPLFAEPWGQGSEMTLGLLGGADRPPQSAVQASDFLTVNRRMRELRSHYYRLSRMDVELDCGLAIQRLNARVMRSFQGFGGQVSDLARRPPGTTIPEEAYRALQKMARQTERDGDLVRAGEIREFLNAIDKRAVEELQTLSTKHEMVDPPSTQAIQLPDVPDQFDWIAAYAQLRGLAHYFSRTGPTSAYDSFRTSLARLTSSVTYRFWRFCQSEDLLPVPRDATTTEREYRTLEVMYRQAAESSDADRAYAIRRALEAIYQIGFRELATLTGEYGSLDTLAAQANLPAQPSLAWVGPATFAAPPVFVGPPVIVPPSVTGGAAQVPVSTLDPGLVGPLVHVPVVPGPPPASSLPGPSLSVAGDPGRWWLDPPATVSGATAAEPVATELSVTPSLGETSSFWLQPFDPVPVPGTVPFDPGVHHAAVAVQPPPLTTAPSTTAPAPGALYHAPSWVEDDFAVERALIAGNLPPGFDASPLIVEAGRFAEFGLAEELAAGRLPTHTIDVLLQGYEATDEGGSNALFIEYLRSLKENIERALRAAYPERVDPQWLDQVRELLSRRGEIAVPGAVSATGLAEIELTEIDRLLGTPEGVSHPAPPPPPAAPGRTAVGTVAPPPVALDPWSAPPGPSSRVMPTQTIRAPVLSTGAPPGWQGAETPGFGRLATGSVELPFSQREAIVHRFRFEDAVLEAELTLRTGGAEALGWSATRWREVLDDLLRLNDIARLDPAAAAAMADIDWSALETLARFLNAPPPSP